MPKRKWTAKRITIGFSKPEIAHLDAYCEATGRDYSDVLRECTRKLEIPKTLENGHFIKTLEEVNH